MPNESRTGNTKVNAYNRLRKYNKKNVFDKILLKLR